MELRSSATKRGRLLRGPNSAKPGKRDWQGSDPGKNSPWSSGPECYKAWSAPQRSELRETWFSAYFRTILCSGSLARSNHYICNVWTPSSHDLYRFGTQRINRANHLNGNRPTSDSKVAQSVAAEVKDLNDMLTFCPSHSKSASSRPAHRVRAADVKDFYNM